MKINQAAIRLIVFVQVNGHQRKLLAIVIGRNRTLMQITHQYNSVVIDS